MYGLMTNIKKVFAYLTKNAHLLVFEHPDPVTGIPIPEAGIQVPGGSVERGESLETAVKRELREETGLEKVTLQSYLGKIFHNYDPSVYGIKLTHERHFFHFCCEEETPPIWTTIERTPSIDPGHKIILKYRWVDLRQEISELIAGQGAMLPGLVKNLNFQGEQSG